MELISLAVIGSIFALALGLAKWFAGDGDDDSSETPDSPEVPGTELGIPVAPPSDLDVGFGLPDPDYPGPNGAEEAADATQEEPVVAPAPLDEVTADLDDGPTGDGLDFPTASDIRGGASTGGASDFSDLDDGFKRAVPWLAIVALVIAVLVGLCLGYMKYAQDKVNEDLQKDSAEFHETVGAQNSAFDADLAQIKVGNQLRDKSIGALRSDTSDKFKLVDARFESVDKSLAKKASKAEVTDAIFDAKRAMSNNLDEAVEGLEDKHSALQQKLNEVSSTADTAYLRATSANEELEKSSKRVRYLEQKARKLKKELAKRPVIKVAEQIEENDPVCPDGEDECELKLIDPSSLSFSKKDGFSMDAQQIVPCPDGTNPPCLVVPVAEDGEQSFARIGDPPEEDATPPPEEDDVPAEPESI